MRKKTKVINKKSNKMHTKKERLTIHNDENIDNGRIKWTLQVIDINKLKPYEKNPRIITEETLLELENSFNEIGMCQPLVVSNDLSIISGNARYLQLKKEGCDKVQVMIPDRKLTEKQEKAVVIRMNKTNVGKWDFDSLANNYEIIDLMDWGFTTEELTGNDEVKTEEKESKKDLIIKIECEDFSELEILQKKFGITKNKIKFSKIAEIISLE